MVPNCVSPTPSCLHANRNPQAPRSPVHKGPRACRFLETLVLTLGPWLSKFSDHDPTVRERVSKHPDMSN